MRELKLTAAARFSSIENPTPDRRSATRTRCVRRSRILRIDQPSDRASAVSKLSATGGRCRRAPPRDPPPARSRACLAVQRWPLADLVEGPSTFTGEAAALQFRHSLRYRPCGRAPPGEQQQPSPFRHRITRSTICETVLLDRQSGRGRIRHTDTPRQSAHVVLISVTVRRWTRVRLVVFCSMEIAATALIESTVGLPSAQDCRR